MKTRLRFFSLLPLAVLVASCGAIRPFTEPTPLPGWSSPVSDLFVDESAFPEGWQTGFAGKSVPRPTANHVTREWWGPGETSAIATQSIWRAYTVADAERKYNELRVGEFQPSRPLNPGSIFVPFEPPSEISFRSQIADEFYLACGWWDWAYCEVIARYRNYVVAMTLNREATYGGRVTHGLTYTEIETVVRAMDAKFAEAMKAFYGSPTK